MKRTFCILLCLVFLACVPTPEAEYVKTKAEGALEAAIEQTTPVPTYAAATGQPEDGASEPTQPTLCETLGVPARVEESFSGKVYGGTLHVQFAADTDVPTVPCVPVYEAALRSFSPEELEQLTRLLLGDGPYYRYDYLRQRRAMLTMQMYRSARNIEALQNRVYGDACTNYDDLIQTEQYYMSTASSILEQEPEPESPQPWTGSFSDGRIALMNANDDALFYADGTFCYEMCPAVPERDLKVDTDALTTEARRLLNLVGGLAAAQPVGLVPADAWAMERYHSARGVDEDMFSATFLPTYAGIPSYNYHTYNGSDTAKTAAGVQESYSPSIPEEQIVVSYACGRIEHLQWDAPLELVAVANENVSLLPFETVLEIFRTEIFRHLYLDPARSGKPETEYTMVITGVRFSYARVKKANAETYYLVPVWDFVGYGEDDTFPITKGERGWYDSLSFLTVNAVDGSIINRNIGY